MKRYGLYFLLVVILLASCGKETENKISSFDGITLNVVTSFDETDGNYTTYRSLTKLFEESTGASINDIASKSDEHWKQQVIEDFNAGNIPDVLFFFTKVPEITNKSVSLDIIRESYPSYAQNISAAVLNDVKDQDGKVYAIPVTGFWEGMFVNKSLFEDNGIEIPQTYDKLLEVIPKFRELSIIPIAASLTHEPHYLFEFLLYNKNGPVGHTKSVSRSQDGSFEKWVGGLNDFRTLYEMGTFPDDINITHKEALDLFQQKKAAMFVDGSWRVGSIEDTNDVIVIPFPGSDSRKTTDLLGGFSMGFYITNEAWENKRDAAVAFVQSMCAPEAVTLFNVNGAASPMASVEAANNSESNLMKSITEMNSKATAFVPALQDKFDSKARDTIFKNISSISQGQMTARDAVEEFIAITDGK